MHPQQREKERSATARKLKKAHDKRCACDSAWTRGNESLRPSPNSVTTNFSNLMVSQHRGACADRSSQFRTPQQHAPTSNGIDLLFFLSLLRMHTDQISMQGGQYRSRRAPHLVKVGSHDGRHGRPRPRPWHAPHPRLCGGADPAQMPAGARDDLDEGNNTIL